MTLNFAKIHKFSIYTSCPVAACVGSADGWGERACAAALPSARSFGYFSIMRKVTE